MSRANKQERHRRKRMERQRSLARAKAVSPYRRIGEHGEIVACYVNSDWHDEGIASLLILRQISDHGYVLASFLIDLWCMGLKDAWGRLDMSWQVWTEELLPRAKSHAELTRLSIEDAHRLILGGVRFAKENGFRLPAKYDRWLSVVGATEDWRTADLGNFGFRGGLHFVGRIEDLRERLIGSSVDDFLAREDVHLTMEAHPSEIEVIVGGEKMIHVPRVGKPLE